MKRTPDGGGLLFQGRREYRGGRGDQEGVPLLRHELIWEICTDKDEMPFSFLFVKIAEGK